MEAAYPQETETKEADKRDLRERREQRAVDGLGRLRTTTLPDRPREMVPGHENQGIR